MNTKRIDGVLWKKLIIASSRYLENHKAIVDALNVFPVPDGDTGTNMSLTIASAAKAVEKHEHTSIEVVANEISYGALMGARGNSGVILSQLFNGFAKGTEGKTEIDAKGFAGAFDQAVKVAYQAVMNPVEGTILTVSKEAAKAAHDALAEVDCNIETVLEAAYQGAQKALSETPNMLPVLKQAGVVDAGGQGLVFILEGMLKILKGETLDLTPVQPKVEEPQTGKKEEYLPGQTIKFQYCTEFILKKKEKGIDLDAIRSFLLDKGDCILVVGNEAAAKVHVHTNRPGQVIDFCTSMASLHEVQIHNMCEQSQEMQLKAKATKHLGIVSVAAGTGLVEILKSLGVDIVITGGQTMNPSTQDFIEAIDSVLAEEVLILPNNGNVVLAAQQAVTVANKPCQVVETKSVPQGIAALMAFNPENDIKYNKDKMEEAGKQIITLEVTYAVRDAQYDGYDIKKDQVLGIADGKLALTGDSASEVVEKLVMEKMIEDHELLTIYYGEGVTEPEAQKLVENLSQKYPDVDFELHLGGQPLYYYLISLE